MSRVGNRLLVIPEQVLVEISGSNVKVKGPLGILERQFSESITILQEENILKTKKKFGIKTDQTTSWNNQFAFRRNANWGIKRFSKRVKNQRGRI